MIAVLFGLRSEITLGLQLSSRLCRFNRLALIGGVMSVGESVLSCADLIQSAHGTATYPAHH